MNPTLNLLIAEERERVEKLNQELKSAKKRLRKLESVAELTTN